GMFMVGRVFASGARLYAAAFPLTVILFGTFAPPASAVIAAIAILATISVLYCFVGGIKSIIWTDVIQSVVFLGAAVAAIVVLLHRIPLGPGDIVQTLAAEQTAGGSKLTLLSFSIDLTKTYTLFTAVFGFSLFMTAAYGTDQDLVQRMLTCRSAVKGSQSVVSAVAISVPVVLLFSVIGLLLFIFYKRADVMGVGAPGYQPAKADFVFTEFILREMPVGLKGLMLAGLFAISLTSTMSALNAMASTVVSDFYRPLLPGRGERHYLRVGRAGVAVWGAVLAGFAALCVHWQASSGESIIQFALSVMTFAYSGLLGVYFTTLLTRRGNVASCLAALATGFLVILVLTPQVWTWWTGLNGWTKEHWQPFKLAFPWRLFIATGAATLVCMLGSPKARSAAPPQTGP
ncbi:MAG: sodium:solute symporter family transporter, partial [Phycisphaerales bacterium]